MLFPPANGGDVDKGRINGKTCFLTLEVSIAKSQIE